MARQHQGDSKANAVNRGGARRAHFASGATLAEWRGRAHTFGDRKHQADKRACRGRTHEAV